MVAMVSAQKSNRCQQVVMRLDVTRRKQGLQQLESSADRLLHFSLPSDLEGGAARLGAGGKRQSARTVRNRLTE